MSRLDRKYKQRTAAHFKVAENKIKIHTNPNQTWNNLEYPLPPKNSYSHIDVKPMVGWVRHGGRDFDIFWKKKQKTPGTTYLVKSIKILHPQASKGQLYTSKSSKCSHPGDIMCKQNPYSRNSLAIKFLWVAWSPLGLSIDRYINILYCCSEFKALYMMGINIFLYVEEGIEQLCKNFFF